MIAFVPASSLEFQSKTSNELPEVVPMRFPLRLILLTALLCAYASGQQPQPLTWSSSNCQNCENTIIIPTWYPDGSSLTAEVIHGTGADTIVSMYAAGDNFVVALGFNLGSDPVLTINPAEAVTLETDSTPHMILYPRAEPGSGIHSGDSVKKKQFKGGTLTINPNTHVMGFLFFPIDRDASRVTVVVSVGSDRLRFPFAKDPSVRTKFVDPETLPSQPSGTTSVQPGIDLSAGLVPIPEGEKPNTEPPVSRGSMAQEGQLGACNKSISFAVAEGGQIVSRVPKFTLKWIEKNGKKYPGTCFSQTPSSAAANFVVVFSSSQSAFDGIYPTVRTSTSSNTSPVSGGGTVTDNYGSWSYTYNGTATTTTVTTSHLDLPYRDTTTEIYAYSYDQSGRLVSRRRRAVTTRQGGEGMNTLGYNLGSGLGAIRLRERLLKDAVDDVIK
jgi:YD repeat-containing protein